MLYEVITGVAADPQRAATLLNQAAEAGEVGAAYLLAQALQSAS